MENLTPTEVEELKEKAVEKEVKQPLHRIGKGGRRIGKK